MGNNMEAWTRSNCPICGRSYPHKEGYKPITCGKFDCLQEANRRGLLDELGRSEDARIAENMKDYWKHQRCGAE